MGDPQRKSSWWINSASELIDNAIVSLNKAVEINPALKPAVDVVETRLLSINDLLSVFAKIKEDDD